ncbi:MAG: NADH-ubiquinone oxidoreductase-F iron-sulfur binding region domain-containing protein, partial [Planctomycetota bacterium]
MTFDEIRDKAREQWGRFDSPAKPRILVGAGTCGSAAGAGEGVEAVRRELKRRSIEADIYEVGCLGLCYTEPLMEFSRSGAPRVLYGNAVSDNVPRMIEDYFVKGVFNGVGALAVMGPEAVDGVPAFGKLPMIAGQVRIVSRNCGLIDPENIYHYIARDGYGGLTAALQMTPEQVIETVKDSGLRGRGGAGFPTALKWSFCRQAPGDDKYMICNADEGDPGAFMDREVIESDPHTVLEGMIIAAYAIGAASGYIYVRAEYPLAIVRLEKAIAAAEELGLLDDGILGSSFSFHVKIKKGAGAFVCGEETSLLASIEGQRGMPRSRPPFPAQKGLYGKPTNINNVETLANVPVILARGGGWFAQYGTQASRGTKTFALAGKVVRTGLVEVPLGITLDAIVNRIGGGIPDGKRFKAVQTGGPSGGCLPASMLENAVDYETLAKAGSIMGSGGMVVMDEDTCMVDVARYFIEFTQAESCGKCVPCRLGTGQMLSILDGITSGRGRSEDLALLEEIAETVKLGSLCGLGQTAPNPVLTTLKYFGDEYRAHVEEGRCPAGVCQGLIRFVIDDEKCICCGKCAKACPVACISGKVGKAPAKAGEEDRAAGNVGEPFVIAVEACVKCGNCLE